MWTANATAGLKLVGESFPFAPGSSLVLPVDAHNSVQGMRAFAGRAGADVKYVSCMKDGGYNLEEALVSLLLNYSSLFAEIRYFVSAEHHQLAAGASTVIQPEISHCSYWPLQPH